MGMTDEEAMLHDVLSDLKGHLRSDDDAKIVLIGDVMMDCYIHGYANNLNNIQDVKNLLAGMASGAVPTPKLQLFNGVRALGDPHYNEAIIYYGIENILGIWADSADESQALAFHQAIKKKYEADLPIVTYKLRKLNPAIHIYNVANFAVDFAIK